MKTSNYNLKKVLFFLTATVVVMGLSYKAAEAQGNRSSLSAGSSSAVKSDFQLPESLCSELQDWMKSGSYWEKKNTDNLTAAQLYSELKQWMVRGDYWDKSTERTESRNKMVQDLKSWMTSGSYWKDNDNIGLPVHESLSNPIAAY